MNKSVVVGIGASAGGLDAFKRLLSGIDLKSGLSYVLIQHLDPTHNSMMPELLSRFTTLPVSEIQHGSEVEANHVYVIPPGKYLHINKGHLLLSEPSDPRGSRMAIDVFFRSLAEEHGRAAIGVVLSGTGSDGTVGLKAIKAAGGLAIAQDPNSAAHPGMPRSVVDQAIADIICPAEDIPQVIRKFISHPYIWGRDSDGLLSESHTKEEEDKTQQDKDTSHSQPPEENIITLLRKEIKVDLGYYKGSNLCRRIERRMGLNQIQNPNDYLKLLKRQPSEMHQLVRDLRISVTDFFRDPEAFDALRKEVAPQLLLRAAQCKEEDGRCVRIWVPGCATGEEAYSIAMLFDQLRDETPLYGQVKIQVFATDVDDQAIKIARSGRFVDGSLNGLSEDQKLRFFKSTEIEGQRRITQHVRDTVSFAIHDLLNDPPFSKLDLISCRNLLIYLRRNAQESALEMFHFGLRSNGFLFLGSSESVGSLGDSFRCVDKKRRLYQRLDAVEPKRTRLPAILRFEGSYQHENKGSEWQETERPRKNLTSTVALGIIAGACAPPTVLVNKSLNVVYLHGNLAEYMDFPQGTTDFYMPEMLRAEIRPRVRAAMFRSARGKESVKVVVKMPSREGVLYEFTVTVRPVDSLRLGDELLLVSFEKQPREGEAPELDAETVSVSSELEKELQATKQDLRFTVEELENANEELRNSNEDAMTMNEELQSTNEELQSTNEELETQSEELRSVNEELITVNSQLREKMDELQNANSDITNLLSSTRLPALFLDEKFCIRRYTAEARKLINVMESDIGRPIKHLAGHSVGEGLLDDAAAVLEGLSPLEREFKSEDGRYYVRRVLPYRTEDNHIGGVVLSFTDITSQKQMNAALARRERQQAAVANLGLHALRGVKREDLYEQVVQTIVHELHCPCLKILELLPDRSRFKLIAGTGWKDGIVGEAFVPARINSQAGFTLQQASPVVVEDLDKEARFSGSALLEDHGIKSGVSVVIHNRRGVPWGVLGVHSKEKRSFAPHDVAFVQGVANVLAGAIQREAVEDSLRAREEEFRTLGDNISQLAWMADNEGAIFWYNKRWHEYTGTNFEDMKGWGWKTVLHPDRLQDVLNKFTECIKTGENWEDTFPLRGRDGAYRSFLSRAIPIMDEHGNVLRWFGTNTDITDTLEAEELLKKERVRAQTIIDNAPAAIYAKDASGTFILSNCHHAKLLGKMPEEVIGNSDLDCDVSLALAEVYRANDKMVWESGESLEFEELVSTPEGKRTFMSIKFPLTDPEGKIYSVCGIATDITKRKEEEKHMRLVMAELNHRVKNSLASVDALARQTAQHTQSVDSFIESFGERIRSLASAYSLLTSQEWRGIPLEELVRGELRSRCSEDKLKIEGEPIVLPAKQALGLHMAIHELATNTCKYGALSRPEGNLQIAWSFSAEDSSGLRLSWIERGGPECTQPTKQGFGGEMIPRVIRYELKGTVEFDWQQEGLSCDISFPLCKESETKSSSASLQPLEESDPTRPTILVVEDSYTIANTMIRELQRLDFCTLGPVGSLDEAIGFAESNIFQGAVLDIDLGGEKSYPLAYLLEKKGTPFVLLSGYDRQHLPDDLKSNLLITKPVDLKKLEAWLKTLRSCFEIEQKDKEKRE